MSEYSDLLREQFAAVKLRTKWWGITKAVDDFARGKMAKAVEADPSEVHAKKYLVNTKTPAYRACTAVRSQAKAWVKDNTLPFPEDGIRLLKRDALAAFSNKMACFTAQLDQAVAALQDAYWDIRQERKTALAGMFREGDYPLTLTDQFSIWSEFPSIEPPNYLQDHNERIWQQEQQRCAARLDEAVTLAEQSLTDEFQKVLTHLVDRLGYDEMGEAKKFRDGSIDNLRGFFDKFRNLSLGSNEQLDELVNAAQAILGDTRPEMLRSAPNVRDVVRQGMTAISERLDSLMIRRPSRAISFDD